MIYPETCGKSDEHLRLRTLESTWIRGKLKMWGRWAAFSTQPEAAGIFNRLLSGAVISQKALKEAIKKMQTTGLSAEHLQLFLEEFADKKSLSSMWFCTDAEGGRMDKVICAVFENNPALLGIIKQHYVYKKSRYRIADELSERHPEKSLSTYRRRVAAWLSVAEYMLYLPMCDEFDHKGHYTNKA
ncbi:DUF1133 family protein [Morganella morganii]|uniref:DUF1133 family protein n=1 Tax=Morganella morganii TaxID=582 RepID=UPI00301CFF6B